MGSQSLPLIEVKGGPRQRGGQQGEGARELIQAAMTGYRRVLPQLLNTAWPELVRATRDYLPPSQEAFPHFVEEIRGIAEGAELTFEEVWACHCYAALLENQHRTWGCTCLAVRGEYTATGGVLMAHNEDWISVDRESVYLVHAEPDDGPAFIGMTYGPLLVNVGFNADGIAVAINSLHPIDGRLGVPNLLRSRAVLTARTIVQAIQACCVPELRAGGYNYLLADTNGELYCVETSATTHSILYGQEGCLVHTNHFLSASMQALEKPGSYASSSVRLNRARRLLGAQLGRATVESLQGLLRDHVGYPSSICSHEDPALPPYEREQTIASLVMDLTRRTMWAAPGPPCQQDYVSLAL